MSSKPNPIVECTPNRELVVQIGDSAFRLTPEQAIKVATDLIEGAFAMAKPPSIPIVCTIGGSANAA